MLCADQTLQHMFRISAADAGSILGRFATEPFVFAATIRTFSMPRMPDRATATTFIHPISSPREWNRKPVQGGRRPARRTSRLAGHRGAPAGY